MVFAGCEKKNKNKEPEQQQQQGGEQQGGEQQQQQPVDFVGLALNDSTVTFDGQPHSISVSGELPEGAQVSYGDAGNTFTAVGDHEVTATITCAGYNTLVLHGTLHIVSAQFAGLSFEGATVTYDGQPHSISVAGELPAGATVDYGTGNEFTNAGTYEITATVHCEGYVDATYQATLTINKANFEGITFADEEVAFDGQPHSIAPNVPAAYGGAQVAYDEAGNTFVGSGLHVVNATVSLANYNDWQGSAKLTIGAGPVATSSLNVIDFEDMTDNDLADEIDLKFYNNGWVNPSAAKVTIEKNQVFASGTNTMKMTMTHQGAAFKATKNLTNKTYNKYSAFAIDTMMDSRAEGGTMKVQVQFWFKDLPLPDAYAGYRNTYATYTLSNNAPSIWTHWEVPFDDESLSIASNATITQAFLAAGYTVEEFSAYIDQVAVIITPNYKDGKNCYAYIDNIQLTRDTEKAVNKFIYGGKYVHIENDDTYALNLADDLSTGSFLLNDAEVSALTITKNGDNIVAKDAGYAGAGLTVTAHIEDDGSLTVATVQGAEAATYSGLVDMNFAKHANINLDFTGASVGNPLVDSHWYQEYWDQTWLSTSGKMNVRGTAADPHCNMTTGYYMDYRYTYTYPEHFGLADKFSIDISNDFSSGSYDLKLKIKLIAATGGETYVVGTSSEYELIPANTAKWMHIEKNNFGEVNVKAIVVTVKSTGSYNQYLYFDNLKLSHSTPEVTPPPQPTYNVEDGEYYIWNAASDAYRLTIADSQTTGTFTKCGSEDSYDVTVAVDGNNVTIKDATANGAGLTVNATLTDNNLMTVDSVSGAMASALSASLTGKTVKHSASVNLDFADGTNGNTYTNSHWTESHYTNSGWTSYDTPTQMRAKLDKNSNKIVNFAASTTAYNYLYTPELPTGPVNHLEVDLGNYYQDNTIRFKIALLGSDGNVAKYVAGDGSNWASIAFDNSNGNYLATQTFDFDLVVAYKVRITVSTASGTGYLYMDNLKVNYKAPEPASPVKTISGGYFYIWNSNTDAFMLYLNDSLGAGSVNKLGGDTYNITAEVDGETVTLRDADYSGNGLTIVLNIIENEKMQVTSVTGLMADTMSGSLLNKQVKKCTNGCNLGFDDGAGSGAYTNANWSEQKYTSSWVDVANVEMNSRTDASSDKIVNFVCDGSARNFIYTPEFPLGPINHISLRLGNYFNTSAGTISYKIAIIDGSGNKTYIAGDASNFATIEKDTSQGSVLSTSINEDFTLMVGYKIQITTKCSAGSAYLYCDDILTSYIAL